MSKRFFLIFTLTILISSSLWGQKTLEGTYNTNFPALGFFGTTITFEPDGRFSYWQAGDLLSDRGTGNFDVVGKYVELYFDEDDPLDRTGDVPLEYTDSLENTQTVYMDNPAKASRPAKYRISGNRLFSIHRTTGKTVKCEQGLSRRRKFLFWGEHYMTTRKHYLKKEKTKP